MAINNIELILPLLNFPNPDTYYFAQVLKRGDTGKSPAQKWTGLITKDRLRQDLGLSESIADKWDARVYISLIPRSLKKFTIEACSTYLERIKTENWNAANYRIPSSVAFRPETETKRLWLFDIDNPEFKEPIEDWAKKEGINIIAEIPTFHGYHFIVPPFNSGKYTSDPDLDVELYDGELYFGIKKTCNTILYGQS